MGRHFSRLSCEEQFLRGLYSNNPGILQKLFTNPSDELCISEFTEMKLSVLQLALIWGQEELVERALGEERFKKQTVFHTDALQENLHHTAVKTDSQRVRELLELGFPQFQDLSKRNEIEPEEHLRSPSKHEDDFSHSISPTKTVSIQLAQKMLQSSEVEPDSESYDSLANERKIALQMHKVTKGKKNKPSSWKYLEKGKKGKEIK